LGLKRNDWRKEKREKGRRKQQKTHRIRNATKKDGKPTRLDFKK